MILEDSMDTKEEEKTIETGKEGEEKKTAEATQPEVKEPEKKVEAKSEGEIETILNGTQKVGFESSLPKEYREEARGFKNLSEYLKHLHGDDGTSWDDLLSDENLKGSGDMLNYLKDSGMTASKAKEFVSAHSGYEKAMDEKMRSMLDETMKGLWGADYEKNKNYMSKGVEVWKNRELAKKYPQLLSNPVVADLLSEIGRANGAPDLLSKGNLPNKEKKTNPNDRFGLGLEELIGED